MKIAIFSDIHGNPYSTKAVLDDIKRTGGFDAVVLAENICLFGSDSALCVDMLRDSNVQVVYGNADRSVFDPQEEPPAEKYVLVGLKFF